jgi:hypothetical protein
MRNIVLALPLESGTLETGKKWARPPVAPVLSQSKTAGPALCRAFDLLENMKNQNPKQRGEWVETLFLSRATQHGLMVSKPWGDSARYDFVVEGGSRKHAGARRLRRVQVKSTYTRIDAGYRCRLVTDIPGGKTARYSATDIEFFAIYVIPESAWYILPVAVVAACHWHVYLNPHGCSRYNRFLEAWHLLGRPVRIIPQIHACADIASGELPHASVVLSGHGHDFSPAARGAL